MSDALIAFIEQFGLLAVFILSALESACIPIPSELVVPPAGFMAAQGALSLTAVVIAATLANTLGSWIAYTVGRRGGRPLIARYGRYVRLNESHLDQAEHWFARHGEATVFIARLLPAFRTFISLPAGIGRMPLGRFLIYSLLGALPWNLALAVAGYELGVHWDVIAVYLKPVSMIAAAALTAAIVWWFIRGQRRRRA
ncbi:DedA family protein [Salinisphaera sp. Q1T1-3]|uniref:DedA family protein n=1 Tax=Salinisphaera sp. Q1T1-3 TaxID=2321229 RepID=UPI000E770EAF|nr:DedA family protein [Salinisphaera sp. Q1T1-3]RJS93550.1 DedA family protein [Salinisphaera sp. Q1T1-3]